ncbi:MAG: DUF370 domain-containing protein [Clostridia bacterium]|nr:DUF370 domain-containing protein [Clostridia bacterium]MBQ6001007.1 DUF370 domain-containing protein [Clostridia bacterium]
MYLHLGKDVVVRAADVIGIFNLETSTVGPITRGFLATAERDSRVTNVSPELPKSFILTLEKGVERVYISQISPATLQKRLENYSEQ